MLIMLGFFYVLLLIAFVSLIASAISYFFARIKTFSFTLLLFYASNTFLSFSQIQQPSHCVFLYNRNIPCCLPNHLPHTICSGYALCLILYRHLFCTILCLAIDTRTFYRKPYFLCLKGNSCLKFPGKYLLAQENRRGISTEHTSCVACLKKIPI